MPPHLLLTPRPQPLRQLPIHRIPTSPTHLPNWVVILTLPHLRLALPQLRSRRPRLVPGPLFGSRRNQTLTQHQHPRQPGMRLVELTPNPCRHATRVHAHTRYGWIPPGQLRREQDVCQFALAIPCKCIILPHIRERFLRDKPPLGSKFMHHACHIHNPDICPQLHGRFLHEWQQALREEEVAHVVGAELQLIPVGGEARGLRHDARVVDKDVEAGLGGEEGLRGARDGGEGREVELEEEDLGCGGAADAGHGGRKGGIVFGAVARAQVDCTGLVTCEVYEGFVAKTAIRAADDDHFAREIRDVSRGRE